MTCQYIEVKADAMSQASPISVMDNHAMMMKTASVDAADISSPSRSRDVYHSQMTSFAHDSSNPRIDLLFHHNCHPSNQLLRTCITFKIESTMSRCTAMRTASRLRKTFADHMATQSFVMDSAVIMVIAADLVAVDNLPTRKMTSAYQQ